MEKHRELGASKVSVLHIAPEKNIDFRKVTSPNLMPIGDSAMEVWVKLTKGKDIFLSRSIEEVFGRKELRKLSSLMSWSEYISERYSWINA